VIKLTAYDVITDRIIKLLEEGTIPWKKPWAEAQAPKNLNSGKKYQGINAFLLNAVGYSSSYWVTYKQANDRGGHVKKGEKGYPVVYWNWQDVYDEEKNKTHSVPFLRYYTVFNVTQCEKIDFPAEPSNSLDFNPITKCEDVLVKMPNPPEFTSRDQRAYYRPLDDIVNMPEKTSFVSEEEFYSTLFHEMVHSTGHEKRLGRKSIKEISHFASHSYSREELVAEMGAAYLCGHCGIDTQTIDNSASYIQGWLGKLNNDKRLVVQAGAMGQKAADYILGNENGNGNYN